MQKKPCAAEFKCHAIESGKVTHSSRHTHAHRRQEESQPLPLVLISLNRTAGTIQYSVRGLGAHLRHTGAWNPWRTGTRSLPLVLLPISFLQYASPLHFVLPFLLLRHPLIIFSFPLSFIYYSLFLGFYFFFCLLPPFLPPRLNYPSFSLSSVFFFFYLILQAPKTSVSLLQVANFSLFLFVLPNLFPLTFIPTQL